MRSNLDPFGIYDDARLWEALKRSYLVDVERVGSVETSKDDSESRAVTPLTQFTLDTLIEDEGNNLSVGQVNILTVYQVGGSLTHLLSALPSLFGKSTG